MSKIKLAVIDNLTLDREALADMFSNNAQFEVISTSVDFSDFLSKVVNNRPDIIILCFSINTNNTPIDIKKLEEILAKINDRAPGSSLVCISSKTSPFYVKEMLAVGLKGYLTKGCSPKEVIFALSEVFAGKKYICQEIRDILSSELLYDNPVPGAISLTKREIQVIEYLKMGYSSKQIANELFLSTRTIEVHRSNLIKKMRVKNTVSLINLINVKASYSYS